MADVTESLYELALAAGTRAPEPPPPRPSAAVALWRRRASGDGGIEVFWVERAETMAFMGGWHAFPGGGLSRRDVGLPVLGSPVGGEGVSPMPESLTAGLADLGPDLPPGLAACALRELWEETGLLLARSTASGEALPPDALDPGETEGEPPLGERLAALGAALDPSRLVFAGRWLTPAFSPQRFDNRFFLLEWPPEAAWTAGVEPRAASREHVTGEWIEPAAALARWRRGEVIAAPPILHLLRVLGEDGPQAGLPRLRDPAEADLGPCRKIELCPGVLLFPLATPTLPPAAHTNAYLLGTGAERVLVDPGSPLPAEIDRLARALAALAAGSPPARVTALWLTHHHPDHVGGVEALRRRLGVPVLAHPATAERLRRHGIAIDRELADGERIELPGDPPFPVRVVHTPGHARGHLCFYDETWGSLLAGDMLSTVSTIVIDPPEGDMDDYLASLDRLIALAPRTLFPAHGPTVTSAVPRLQELVRHRLWREERVLAAWRAGRRTPAAMLAEVYADAPPEAAPLAERQIAAHLERLRRQGRI